MKLPRLLSLLLLPLGLHAATLEELVAQPELRPAEVTVKVATRATVVRDGQDAGMMLVGAGKVLAVTDVSAGGVTGRFGAATVRVPVEKTDLLARTGAVAAAPAAAEPTPPPPPAAEAKRPAAAKPAAGPTRMQRQLAGKLVRLEGGSLKPVDDRQLAGVKYYAIYFSASWCGPCRQFTPELVKAYAKLKQGHPEFELVFFSADRSAGSMRDYMKEDKMPWPAVSFDQREDNIQSYCGPGIPCLVLVDTHGRVLSDSFEGENYVGPGKVLNDTFQLLARNQ